MPVSIKVGLVAFAAWLALGALAAGVAPPPQWPSDVVAIMYYVTKLEATVSIQWLSAGALATGVVALIYSAADGIRTAYRWLGDRRRGTSALPLPLDHIEGRAAPRSPAAAVSIRSFRRSTEFMIVLAVVGAVFLINIATIELYPMAWVDEAYFADPAINLLRGHGLTSSVWGHAYWGEFWVSYVPLYSLLLAGWARLVGVHLSALRLLNDLMISGAAILLWHYTVRSPWFPSLRGRLVVVLLPLLGYGICLAYRSIRPDTLGILLAVLALEASTLRDPRWRVAALILVGALLPWTSPSLPVFAGIVGLLVALWWFRHALRLFLPVGIGIALGLVTLFGMYLAAGRLYMFLYASFGSNNTITGQATRLFILNDPRSWERLEEIRSLLLGAIFTDRSSALLTAAALLMLVSLRHSTQTIAVSASRFAVAAALAIPILMQLAGRYSLYYTWMGLLTVGIAVVISLENSVAPRGVVAARRLAVGCIALALVIGLPLQLAIANQMRDARNYNALRAYVGARVTAGDWVYVTPAPYFAAAELGAVPVLIDYAWGIYARGVPEDQRQRIKKIIVTPEEAQAAMDRLGGTWQRDGAPFRPPPVKRLTWGEFDNAYTLDAYRRE